MSDYIIRALLREIAERAEGDSRSLSAAASEPCAFGAPQRCAHRGAPRVLASRRPQTNKVFRHMLLLLNKARKCTPACTSLRQPYSYMSSMSGQQRHADSL